MVLFISNREWMFYKKIPLVSVTKQAVFDCSFQNRETKLAKKGVTAGKRGIGPL
jgi:hypothetical protein